MPPEDKKAAQKQKIMLGATALIVLFVGWQGYKLMAGGDSTPAPTPTQTAGKTATSSAGQQAGSNNLATANPGEWAARSSY